MSSIIFRTEIKDIYINDFKSDSNGFSLFSLNELADIHFSFLSEPHRINFYQIILVTEGNGFINVDSSQYEFSNRNLIAIAKGQVEFYEIDKSLEGYALQFTEDFIHKYPGDLDWFNNLKLFNPYCKPLYLSLTSLEHLHLLSLIESILKELDSENDFVKNDILINLFKYFLLIAERIKHSRKEGGITDIMDWSLLISFKNKLEENFFRNRMVNFYAGELNITQKKLNEVTTNFWGKSVKQVIEERVLLEIKRLLTYTNKTIKEIGLSLGFSDPTNFNKFFKKYENSTPAKFRLINKKHTHHHNSALINHL